MQDLQPLSDTKDRADSLLAILGPGTQFEGKLSFEGTVRISGEFKGEIYTNDVLVIDKTADFEGQIEADEVIVSGDVKGNIFARTKVMMHAPAHFTGTVTTPSLSIDDGVVFEGASYMPQTT